MLWRQLFVGDLYVFVPFQDTLHVQKRISVSNLFRNVELNLEDPVTVILGSLEVVLPE